VYNSCAQWYAHKYEQFLNLYLVKFRFIASSALIVLVEWQEGHAVCKRKLEWWGAVVLAGARCRLAYGPADATATHCLLLQ